jgi:hypothetical protein
MLLNGELPVSRPTSVAQSARIISVFSPLSAPPIKLADQALLYAFTLPSHANPMSPQRLHASATFSHSGCSAGIFGFYTFYLKEKKRKKEDSFSKEDENTQKTEKTRAPPLRVPGGRYFPTSTPCGW